MDKKKSLYSRLCNGTLSLQEHLAAIRSILANERTLLAYLRTAITLFVAGVSFIKFFGSLLLWIMGWVFVFLAGITLVVGVRKYRHIKILIQREEIEGLHCRQEENGSEFKGY